MLGTDMGLLGQVGLVWSSKVSLVALHWSRGVH